MKDALDRKFSLQRISSGDYVFLSNDESIIWRVAIYTEDGSAVTSSGREIRGSRWGLWKFTGRDMERINTNEWNDFEMWDAMFRTRNEAIMAALRDA